MSSNRCSLTFPQNNIYMVEKVESNSTINTIAGTLKITGEFDIVICNKIINNLIKLNDALRIKIVEENNQVFQNIDDYKYENIQIIDMSDKNYEIVKNYLDDLVKIPISLYENKLYDFKIIKHNHGGCIFMKLHHIISDAWTLGQVINQLVEYYEECIKKNLIDREIPSYTTFIDSEKEYLNSDKYIKDEEFWKENLKNISEPISIKSTSKKLSNNAKRYSVKLEKKLHEKILSYTKENKISPYALFLATIGTYIYRIKQNNNFVIGTPALNRSNFKEKYMLGMFVSTMPININIEENMNFLDLVKQIGKSSMSLFRHQKYPFVKILDDIHKTTNIKGKIFNIMLSYQNARASIAGSKKYSTEWIFSKAIQDELEIHIMDMDNTGSLQINYDYLIDLFDDIEIEYLHKRIVTILENALANIDISVEDIEIMPKEEKDIILYNFNKTTSNYPKNKTIVELFEEQVEKNPDNIAIVFENNKLTYRELNQKSNQLAHYLKEIKNVETGNVISIMLNKSIDLLITILGILKCGGIYLPIDNNLPQERVNYILNDSESKYIICELNKYDNKFLNINDIKYDLYSKENLNITSNNENVVYIMYTSGTTGKPKGVMIKNKNVVRLVKNTNYITIYKNDRMVQTGSIGFDATTLEYWGTLLNGASLYMISYENILNPVELKKFLWSNCITLMWLTAPLYNQLVNYDITIFEKLRVLLIGGDTLSAKHVNKLLDSYKNVKIINGYGPTENTTFSTCHIITKKYDNNIPIGKPISNSKCYIVDKKLRILPIGIKGELLVGGDGVAKGYINREDLTKEKFIFFKNDKDIVYKTGDDAYWNFEGEIEFVGRIDNQVKIRGFRIELGEINRCILSNCNIKESFINIEELNGQKILVAYYSCIEDYKTERLIEYLKENLPNYMVPSQLIKLDKLPLNSNGKIDKNLLLKEKYITIHNTDKQYFGKYKIIYDLFKTVLNKSDIDENDSFFDIGGDSLLAIEFVTKAMAQNVIITYADLYKYSSIKSLGDMIINKIEKSSISSPIKEFDYKKINDILSQNVFDLNDKYQFKNDVGNILLVGATGFLGAHILDSYMQNKNGKIYCIIRSKGEENVTLKLKEKLNFFFSNKYDSEIGKRIIIIDGDITNNKLVTNEDDYKLIVNSVDTIINSAAYVKHFGELKYFEKINIEGTKNLIDFCVLNNKKMIHLSTLSVSGNILETGQIEQTDIKTNTIYNETNLYIYQNLDNVYAYTKFMSEKIVYDAMINSGLKAKIMRMGNLTGRYNDGKFQPNVEDNAFANRLKTIIELGVMPQNILEFYLEFTPIDYAADAVLKLSETDNKYNTFHIFNHKHAQMEFVNKTFEKMNINLKIVSKDEMTKLLSYYMEKEDGYRKIQGIVLDINKNKELDYKPNTIVKSDFSIEVLKQNKFEWPEVTIEYIIKYINYLFDIGFLKKG